MNAEKNRKYGPLGGWENKKRRDSAVGKLGKAHFRESAKRANAEGFRVWFYEYFNVANLFYLYISYPSVGWSKNGWIRGFLNFIQMQNKIFRKEVLELIFSCFVVFFNVNLNVFFQHNKKWMLLAIFNIKKIYFIISDPL